MNSNEAIAGGDITVISFLCKYLDDSEALGLEIVGAFVMEYRSQSRPKA